MHHSFRHYKLVIDHCVTSYHSVDLRYIKRNFCCLSFDVFRRELSNGMYFDVESPSHTLTGHFDIFIPDVIRVIEKHHFFGKYCKKLISVRQYRLLKEDMVRNFISNERVFISEKIILSTFVDVISTND